MKNLGLTVVEVLLAADPLKDITHPKWFEGVVANGTYFPKQALKQLLAPAKISDKTR